MENLTIINISELLVIIFSVLLGSGAYISFVHRKNKEKISISYILPILIVNLFWTYLVSKLLTVANLGKWSDPALLMVAFCGQYIAEWFHKNNPKLFDFAAKKVGVDLNNKKDDNNEKTIEDEDK